jgi:L-2,4-diaminobutyric acid acetyltransferase
MKIRKTVQEDFLRVHKFTAECPTLENYPVHVYKIILRYFGNYCFIVEEKDEIIGFAMGIVGQRYTQSPQSYPDTYFLWDIGTHPSYQRQGIGEKLITEIEKELKKLYFRRIELSIDPANIPSRKLFEKMGYHNISENEGDIIDINGNKAIRDYYSPGRHFMIYEKQITYSETDFKL